MRRHRFVAVCLVASGCFTDIGDIEQGTAGAAGVSGGAGSGAGGAGGSGGVGGGAGSGGAAGCAADLETDPAHCGACDHSCLGNACSGGVCDPIVLTTGQDRGYAIAVDGAAIYWTSEHGTLNKLDVGGGTSATLANGTAYTDLRQDAQSLFWTAIGDGSVHRIDKSGTNASALASQGLMQPSDLFVDDGGVFFSDTEAEQIWFVQKDGTGLQLLASAAPRPRGIAADATHVYFTGADGAVRRAPRGGGAAELVSSAPSGFYGRGLVLDADHVYWRVGEIGDFAGAEGHVYKVPKAGGPPTSLADSEPGPRQLAIDGEWLYWTNLVSGTVSRVRKDGTGRLLLAKGQDNAHGIAVDATAVYWINWAGGELAKTGK